MDAGKRRKSPWLLSLGALGMVLGDIGTSPLYAFRECVNPPHGVSPTPANVLGLLSLVFWSLWLVVGVKYLAFVVRADNQGEGGTLALTALAARSGDTRRFGGGLVVVGLLGTALVYGEGLIAPAISVLSAAEGIGVAAPALRQLVVPAAVVVLAGVFLLPARGQRLLSGPIMLVWFVSIAAAGLPWIVRNPAVLGGIDPRHALSFFAANRLHGFFVLGSIVLIVAGVEALYADLGFFGRGPIRRAWFLVALPALLINYFGQGALVTARPAGAAVLGHTFYAMLPYWALFPMVAITLAATVVASRALVSAVFSLVHQGIELGWVPRLQVLHVARETKERIHIPVVNALLLAGSVALVIVFRRSSNLAAAYGLAVSGTMATTSVLFYFVAVRRWGWRPLAAGALVAAFLAVDLPFLGGSLIKLLDGGWVPLAVAFVLFVVMSTWRRGRLALTGYLEAVTLPVEALLEDVRRASIARVRGTAIFLGSNASGVPPVLLHHLKHNKVLHRQVVFLSIEHEDVPEVPAAGRASATPLGEGFWRVRGRHGFMQTPYVPEILERCAAFGLHTDPSETSYFLGRETVLASGSSGLPRWRKALFAFLSQNVTSATTYFGLPVNRVVEMGAQVEL